jgi:hypothetical protein
VTQAIASQDTSRNGLLAIAAGGVLSGVLTPLLPQLIDRIGGGPGDLRIALVAVPFAVLVFMVVRSFSANPRWAALLAAIVTMVAFVCAVNAAIFIDGQANGADKMMRNILAGLAGGFTGSAIMALGIGLLPAGPRDVVAWLQMLVAGTLAGALLALDNALGLDQTSVLYPVWRGRPASRSGWRWRCIGEGARERFGRVGKATGSRECAPDDRLRVPAILDLR